MPRDIRVRFAPSPTGALHLGGVRTALYNYLFAKKTGGKFLLRIEDTDRTRYVPEAENYILEALEWCGLKVDEGVGAGGEYGPYRQSERKDLYRKYALQLVASGHAYYCFDTNEELDAYRKDFESRGDTFIYNVSTRKGLKNSLQMPPEEVDELLARNRPYTIRFKMPEDETVNIYDLIRGEVSFRTSILDDKVLFKSDGMPTYHLANIVDDHLMKISHVIRGEEWLPSLPLHVLLYKAFGWENTMPEFAHLPLILKPAGNGKLSKRDGNKMGFPVFPLEFKDETSGEIWKGYREDGYFPEAFVNMLALLGWNPGTEQEIFSMDELIRAFSIERVGKASSRFNPEKTKWFNHKYLVEKSDTELAKLLRPIVEKDGIETTDAELEKICGLMKNRASFVSDIYEESLFFFKAPETYAEKDVKKHWKPESPDILKELAKILESEEDFRAPVLENAVSKWINSRELGFGKVMNPLRIVIVGAAKGPHVFDILEILGKKESLERIGNGLERLKL